MTAEQLGSLIKECGIVGAGGAGFPTYAKIDSRAQVILMNCAECEPLLKLHRQLLKLHTKEIVDTFSRIAETVGAKEAVIGVKAEYAETVEALKQYVPEHPNMRIQLLQSVYPTGDEVILIYEATGRVISPGGLPIEAGVAVFNVETVYNISRALAEHAPVTDKLVSVVGEVKAPATVRVPLGTSLEEVVKMAGGETALDPEELAYLVGGPMMGRLGSRHDTVTRTTNAILVLPKDHPLILRRQMPPSAGMKRAASSCCQCETCTDLCPRHNLGHPIEPHRFMRAMSNHDYGDLEAFENLFFCSGCGVCELFACPQGLSPRSLIADCKDGLKKAGLKAPKAEGRGVSEAREYRKVPEKRLTARLGLSRYDHRAPLDDRVRPVHRVRELLSQHIGAPAVCAVGRGEKVRRGQVIAAAAAGLSVPVHASIDGVVTDIGKTWIEITAEDGNA